MKDDRPHQQEERDRAERPVSDELIGQVRDCCDGGVGSADRGHAKQRDDAEGDPDMHPQGQQNQQPPKRQESDGQRCHRVCSSLCFLNVPWTIWIAKRTKAIGTSQRGGQMRRSK